MNRSERFVPWTLAGGLLLTAGAALGQGMPAGAMQWIKVNGNYPQPTGAVGALAYPSPNYVTNPQFLQLGCTIYANADSTANRLRNSYWRWRTDSVFLSNAMVDTYTISGPAGTQGAPVTAHVRLTPHGNLFVGPRAFGSGTIYCCSSFLQVKIGTWSPSTDPGFLEQFRVAEFDSSFFGQQSIPTQNYGSNQPILPVTLVVQGDLVRTVGQPFDVGYMITTNGEGVGNIPGTPSPDDSEYLTYSVHWDLPPGYSVTSVRGWTDPDAPPPPACGSADFNGDGDLGTDGDIEAFFLCLGGNCCASCDPHGADFNGDGDIGTDADIESFFRVLGGGPC